MEVDAQRNAEEAANIHVGNTDGGIGGSWALPKAFYHHVGKRVVLQLRILGTKNNEDAEDLQDTLRLRAVVVSDEDHEKLLFCRVAVHSRLCYGERIKKLIEGWPVTAVEDK